MTLEVAKSPAIKESRFCKVDVYENWTLETCRTSWRSGIHPLRKVTRAKVSPGLLESAGESEFNIAAAPLPRELPLAAKAGGLRPLPAHPPARTGTAGSNAASNVRTLRKGRTCRSFFSLRTTCKKKFEVHLSDITQKIRPSSVVAVERPPAQLSEEDEVSGTENDRKE